MKKLLLTLSIVFLVGHLTTAFGEMTCSQVISEVLVSYPRGDLSSLWAKVGKPDETCAADKSDAVFYCVRCYDDRVEKSRAVEIFVWKTFGEAHPKITDICSCDLWKKSPDR